MFKIRMGRCCNQEIVITHLKRKDDEKVYKGGGEGQDGEDKEGWGLGREEGGGSKGSDHKLRNDCSLEAGGSRV